MHTIISDFMRLNTQTDNTIFQQQSFENNLKTPYRKDFGVFLTNNIQTIDNILSIIDFNDSKILTRKFLEPSCGNGVFVIRLLEKIFDYEITIKEAQNFIQSSIYFVDIDEKMITITESNINKFFKLRFGVDYDGQFNSYVFDYTQRIKPKNENNLFDLELDVPLKQQLKNIDYIFGNPPYVSLYGRRDRKKDEAQRMYYLNRYSQFPNSLKNGKINYVMLFIEQSIDLLKDGGNLSLIIDLAFFETAYQYTRKYLLDNTKILSIEYNIKDFDVASGQLILKVQKGKTKNSTTQIIDAEKKINIEINQKEWNTPKDQYKFRFNISKEKAQIINKIEKCDFHTLKQLHPKKNLRTCVMLLNLENRFVFEQPNESLNVDIYPYYQGSKGLKEKFGVLNNGSYFHFNKKLQDSINDELKAELTAKGIKNKKRLGLGEKIIYDNPKVYIRQSAKEIIATFDKKPSSANNSLYVFSLRNSSNDSVTFLKFLTGFLNSELITFYAQEKNIIRFSKGKQPQIKTSDLYTVPIPTNVTFQNEIALIVDEIYKSNNTDLQDNINTKVYAMFNIDSNEVCTIKESILNF